MPLVRPAWITLTIFSFIGTWNDFFTPLIFTRSEQMKTLPLVMSAIGGGPGIVARSGAVAAATADGKAAAVGQGIIPPCQVHVPGKNEFY